MSYLFDLKMVWTILIATVIAFVLGALWNSSLLFGKLRQSLAGNGSEQNVRPWMPAAELVRCLVLSTAVVVLLSIVSPQPIGQTLVLAGLVWLGFQANLLIGGVIWERMPFRLFLIHAGDALVKIMVIAGFVNLFLD